MLSIRQKHCYKDLSELARCVEHGMLDVLAKNHKRAITDGGGEKCLDLERGLS